MIDPRKAELAAADHGYFAMTLGARELKYMRSFKKGRLRVNVYFTTGTVGRLSKRGLVFSTIRGFLVITFLFLIFRS